MDATLEAEVKALITAALGTPPASATGKGYATYSYNFRPDEFPLDIFEYSDYPKDKSYVLDLPDNNYFHIHTKPSDALRYEKLYEYDFVIDTRIGFISIRDNDGNFIELNSPTGTVTIRSNKNIILDSDTITLRSNNGCLQMDKDGLELDGNKVELDTRIPSRGHLKDYSEIDKLHTRGGRIDRAFPPVADNHISTDTKVLQDTSDTKLISTNR